MIYQFKAEQTDANLNFDIQLDKDKQVYCFIGENGVGKTNLLENMAKTAMYCHSIFLPKQDGLTYAGYYFISDFNVKTKDLMYRLPTHITLNDQELKNSHRDEWNIGAFENLRTERRHFSFNIDKPFVFIGARTRGYTQNVASNAIEPLGDVATRFLAVFLKSFHALHKIDLESPDIANWIISRLMIDSSFIPKHQNRSFEVLMLLRLIKRFEPVMDSLISDTMENGTVTTKANVYYSDGKLFFAGVPLDKLSTGYIGIVKIFQEIVAGYGGWTNANNEKDLRETDGIVFIDEIEAHLHPKWQCQIIPLLKEFFPKTTFYVGTHSPLIVSTTEEGEAYELIRTGNDVTAKRLGNPKEWYLTDVFSHAFHVDFTEAPSHAGNGKASVSDLLKEFSLKVRDFTGNKDAGLKTEIDALYQRILPNLPEDDPRRRSLDSLRSLVK